MLLGAQPEQPAQIRAAVSYGKAILSIEQLLASLPR